MQEQFTDPNRRELRTMNKLFVVWASIVAGSIAAWTLAGSLGALDLKGTTPDKVGTVLTSLMFVALLIERAVEVFVSPITADDKQNLIGEQNKTRAAIADLQALLMPLPTAVNQAPPQPDEAQAKDYKLRIDNLQKADQQFTVQINAIDKQTQRLALSFSVPISFVVALAGVRAFGPFLVDANGTKLGSTLSSTQTAIFAVADVVLTAGLLAGGADGIHKILDRFIKLASGKDVQQPIK